MSKFEEDAVMAQEKKLIKQVNKALKKVKIYFDVVPEDLKNLTDVVVKLNKKHKDDTERIDPVAGMMNGLALALLRRNNPTLSDRMEDEGWTL